MKLLVIDKITGEELEGIFFIQDAKLWEADFDSANSATNPTRQWNGNAFIVIDEVIIKLEI